MGSGNDLVGLYDWLLVNKLAIMLFQCYSEIIASHSLVIPKLLLCYSQHITNLFQNFSKDFHQFFSSNCQVIVKNIANLLSIYC